MAACFLFLVFRVFFLVESGNRGVDMLKVSSLFVSFFSLVFSGILSADGSHAAEAQDTASN
jgi:hypothetical protein